jgi:hypothetical protein
MNVIPLDIWLALTHLGAAGLALPLVLLVAAGFCLEGWGRVAAVWLGSLGLAVCCVVASKVAFAGWGVGSVTLNFTGASGHATLASAVFPVLLGWLIQTRYSGGGVNGILLGLLAGGALSGVVGCSRVAIGAHSWSEVALGWLVGMAAGVVSCREMLLVRVEGPSFRLRFVLLPMLAALCAMSQHLAASFSASDWETRVALALSGRDHPYQRGDLFRPPAR